MGCATTAMLPLLVAPADAFSLTNSLALMVVFPIYLCRANVRHHVQPERLKL
jgi:hypothetical protein